MKKIREMTEIKSWKLLAGLIMLLVFAIVSSISLQKMGNKSESAESFDYGMVSDNLSGWKNEGIIAPEESFAPPSENGDSMVTAVYNIESETKSFEEDIDSIQDIISEVDGYVSSHNIGTQKNSGIVYKVGRMTLRIPKNEVNQVLEVIRSNTYVLTESSNSNDVTKQYKDLEASIESLEEQEQKLNELFEQAKTVDEIIKLDEKVRSVIREKEALQRNYMSIKDEVTYSRMDIQIKEVAEYTMVETMDDSSFTRVKKAFVSSFKNIGNVTTDVLVFMASISPFIIILLLGGFAYVKIKKKRGDKHE